jgi:hypothetical protein
MVAVGRANPVLLRVSVASTSGQMLTFIRFGTFPESMAKESDSHPFAN